MHIFGCIKFVAVAKHTLLLFVHWGVQSKPFMGSLSGATSTNRRRYACGVGLREDDGCLAFGWFWSWYWFVWKWCKQTFMATENGDTPMFLAYVKIVMDLATFRKDTVLAKHRWENASLIETVDPCPCSGKLMVQNWSAIATQCKNTLSLTWAPRRLFQNSRCLMIGGDKKPTSNIWGFSHSVGNSFVTLRSGAWCLSCSRP